MMNSRQFHSFDYRFETFVVVYRVCFDGLNMVILLFSDADINFNLGASTRFTPIDYYRNTGEQYSMFVSSSPENITLESGACNNAFAIPGMLPSQQRNVQIPQWESPFAPQRYIRPVEVTPAPNSSFPCKYRNHLIMINRI